MRVFQIEYSLRGVNKVEFIKGATNTAAIRTLTNSIGQRDKNFFKLVSVKLVTGII